MTETLDAPTPYTVKHDGNGPEAADMPNALRLAWLGLRHRWIVLAGAFGLAFVTGIVLLIVPKKYTTTVSFTPVTSDIASALGANVSGLASQFGVSLPGSDPSQSPNFYASLLVTQDVQQPLVETQHVIHDGKTTLRGNFVQLYDIDEGDSGKSIAEALRQLNKKILSISFDNQTSIVEVSVTTKWRDLSYAMATQLLDVVNEFNLASRQQQGVQERRFLGGRVDTAATELHRAENNLQAFLQANRLYQNDPQLIFEFDRLQREVTLRESVYQMLVQMYEQARLEAVRNTPSISVVQHPVPALRFDRRNIALKTAAAFVFGGGLAFVFLLMRASLVETAATPEFEPVARDWADFTRGARRFWPFGRRTRRQLSG